MRAIDLAALGWAHQDIAVALNVSEAAVSHWVAAARRGGEAAIRSRPRAGRQAKLTDLQIALLPDILWHGAEAYGFRGDVWTCERVAGALVEEFGVSYSKSQVSRILKRLNWTPQIPMTRAIQRNEAEIERWRKDEWPVLKRIARQQARILIFVDEAGFYLLPSVARTYAPKGRTPVLKHWESRDHISVICGISSKGHVYSMVKQTSLNGEHCLAFLTHLHHMTKERVLVVWDRSPIHRRAIVQEFALRSPTKLKLEPLPAYAPDLNPVEWLWKQLKIVELRNLSCLDLEQLHGEFHLALDRVRNRRDLIQSFFSGAGLKP